jgi:hypothetical protein
MDAPGKFSPSHRKPVKNASEKKLKKNGIEEVDKLPMIER